MTRFVSRLFLATLLTAAIASPALAQSGAKSRSKTVKKVKRSKKRVARSKEAPAKKAKSFEFEPDKIDGDRINPDGTTVFGIIGNKHPSLIRVRGDFIGEILKSAENI